MDTQGNSVGTAIGTHDEDRLNLPEQNKPTESQLVAHETALDGSRVLADNETIRRVVQAAKSTVGRFQTVEIPKETPTWLRLHHLLVFGERQYAQRHEDRKIRRQKAVDDTLGQFKTGPRPFTPVSGHIMGQRRGEIFDTQHHPDQFLYLIACSGEECEAKFWLNSEEKTTVKDILDGGRYHFIRGQDLPWTLAANAILAPNDRWTNKFGEPHSAADLASLLMSSPDLTCGGTHQNYALARALRAGVFHTDLNRQSRCRDLLHAAMDDEISTQQETGALRLPPIFNTHPRIVDGHAPHIVNIHYSGHAFEWMVRVADAEDLRQSWAVNLASFLTRAIDEDFPDAAALLPPQSEQDGKDYGFISHAICSLQQWLDLTTPSTVSAP